MTISNAATNAIIQTHLLYELAERAMDVVIRMRDKIDAMLSHVEGYNPKTASFSFRLGQTGFVIYENHGIPYDINDLLNMKDIPATYGAEPFHSRIPSADHAVVRRASHAGTATAVP